MFFLLAKNTAPKNVLTVAKSPLSSLIKEELPLSIEHYSENLTKNVRHKLDLLLKRINKRHDFNGAVLVAKNEKNIVQQSNRYCRF